MLICAHRFVTCLTEFYQWKVNVDVIKNQTGPKARWFITVYSFNQDMDAEALAKLEETLAEKKPLDKSKLTEFKGNYTLRTWTTGCYYYAKKVFIFRQTYAPTKEIITCSNK